MVTNFSAEISQSSRELSTDSDLTNRILGVLDALLPYQGASLLNSARSYSSYHDSFSAYLSAQDTAEIATVLDQFLSWAEPVLLRPPEAVSSLRFLSLGIDDPSQQSLSKSEPFQSSIDGIPSSSNNGSTASHHLPSLGSEPSNKQNNVGNLQELNFQESIVGQETEKPLTQAENVFTSFFLRPDPGTINLNNSLSPITNSSITFRALDFDQKEGSFGTVQVQLNQSQAPTSDVVLTFSPGDFLVVDTDNNSQNGTQRTITITPTNWNQPYTIRFLAEKDGVATDRTFGNILNYTLSGGINETGRYDLGVIQNTYAPDLTQFNIDLDFRNDSTGFWTPERQAIAQKAANDWAVRIANEWSGLQLNHTISQIGNDGTYTDQTFEIKQFVDDVLVLVNTIDSGGSSAGFGGPEYDIGGWITSPEVMPRVGQIAIDLAVGDDYLYNAISHEIGHVLGLLGLNWAGYLQQDLSTPETAVFKGAYSTIANGGNYIPLQSQDGANPVTGEYDYWHPANSIQSIMSYGWMYNVTGPTSIDFAMLADSGYRVYGLNA